MTPAEVAVRSVLGLHAPVTGYYANSPWVKVCAHCTSGGDPYTHPVNSDEYPCATVAGIAAAGIEVPR